MNFPDDLKYTREHEWCRLKGNRAVIGITDHAQEALGDIVFFEVQELGKSVTAGDTVAVIESVKAASDIYAPVAGEVVAANAALADAPEQVNADAFAAWMFRIKPDNPVDVDKLLDANAYQKAAAQ